MERGGGVRGKGGGDGEGKRGEGWTVQERMGAMEVLVSQM